LAGKRSHESTDNTSFRGLGYLDNHKDILTLEFTYPRVVREAGKTKTKASKRKEAETETLEVQLAQDKTALRSRKGDTGSVLWRARLGIHQHHEKTICSSDI
jgi:protein N-lysine methyltransferase METTL21D